jgi:hypothetical protein
LVWWTLLLAGLVFLAAPVLSAGSLAALQFGLPAVDTSKADAVSKVLKEAAKNRGYAID